MFSDSAKVGEDQSRVLEADLMYIVTWDGLEVILHVEFQKRRDGNMDKRLWKYNAQATIIMDLPVCSFVIYLTRDGNVVQSPYKVSLPNGVAVHRFEFNTIKLWEMPGEFLKQEGIEGLLPLLPLTQNGIQHEVVDDMIVSLNSAGKSDLLALAYTFASLVFKNTEDRDWLRKRFAMLSEDIFEEAWAYQEIIAKGREKGLHEGLHKGELLALRGVIVDIVQRRFPPLVTLVSSHIQKMEDATQLHHLSVELSIAQTVQEAEQAFKAIAKDAQQH